MEIVTMVALGVLLVVMLAGLSTLLFRKSHPR
jgi:hypothetical protein